MALVLMPAVRRAGVRLTPGWRFRHPAVRQLLRLSGWTLGYVSPTRSRCVVVRNLADPGSGDARAYFNAFTFFVLPHGLLAVSIATTFAPEMARSVTRRRPSPRSATRSSLGTRLVALLTLPAGVLIVRAAPPDRRRRSCEHGAFTRGRRRQRRRALGGFALGLVGFSIYLFVLRGFYAHQDTRTPFVINVGAERRSTSCSRSSSSAAYGILGLGAASPSPTSCRALWALQVMSYKVPGFPLRDRARQPVADGRAPPRRRRGDVAGADRVGGDAGGWRLVRMLVGGRSSAWSAYVAVAGSPCGRPSSARPAGHAVLGRRRGIAA